MTLNSPEDKEVHSLETWHNKKEKRLTRTEELIVDLLLSRTELSTPVNGTLVSEMVLVVKCGQMVQDMKAIGSLIKLTVKENLSMLMETFMKASGSMTKLMAKEHIHMPMEPTIMEIGSMINNMDSEWSPGLMVLSTRETTSMERKKEKENLHLLMEVITKENLNKTRYADMENTTGQMVSNMTDNGAIIKCTEKVF